LGVLGIHEATLYVTVSIVVPIITKLVNKDRIEKVGRPRTPLLSLPSNTICDPNPRRIPEIMSRRVDIFCRYKSSS